MPGSEKRRRETETKKSTKKKARHSELMTDEQIQAASRRDLLQYQAANSKIFNVKFDSRTLTKIRTDFIKQQAVFEANKHAGENDDDDEEEVNSDDEEEDDDDDDDDDEDEDDEDDEDDEESDSEDDGPSSRQRKKRSYKKSSTQEKSAKTKSRMKNIVKTVQPSLNSN